MSMLRIKQTRQYQKWESSLKDANAKSLIASKILRLAQGLSCDVKHIDSQIKELRVHYGAGYRIYFEKREDILIVILCGGDKSTQKRDIERAKELAKKIGGE